MEEDDLDVYEFEVLEVSEFNEKFGSQHDSDGLSLDEEMERLDGYL